MDQTETRLEKTVEKVDGGILKSLIDKWVGRLEYLEHKDRHDSEDIMLKSIYREIGRDLQKL